MTMFEWFQRLFRCKRVTSILYDPTGTSDLSVRSAIDYTRISTHVHHASSLYLSNSTERRKTKRLKAWFKRQSMA